MKEIVGRAIAERVKDGDIIGVGTGSTVDAVLGALGERLKKERLFVRAVPTSYQSMWRLEEIGVITLSPEYSGMLSWGFDGADAVDEKRRAIKGRGGALLEEKILASKCSHYVIVVDESKLCSDVCVHCEVPIEVIPSAAFLVQGRLREIGASLITVRNGAPGKHGPVITERGNVILDARFPKFSEGLEQRIKSITGVVDSGLFEGHADEVLVACADGSLRTM